MKYLSVASGMESATLAWHPLGWKPWAFAELAKFPSALLKLHYPDVPNLGDMTKFKEWPDAVFDVLVGGTPCQSYSVAGLRAGLDDPRGDLMLTYGAIARRYRPRWLAWENVPGVISDDEGRSFGTLLGLLSGQRVEVPVGGWRTAGVVEGYKGAYGLAWRVLDTQYVRTSGFPRAIPQRRRRVFVVGYLGDWRRAAAVFFEREGLSWDPAPGRKTAEDVAGALSASSARRGGVTEGERGGLIAEVAPPLNAGGNETGGDRQPGTSVDTVESLIPMVANPLTHRMYKGVNTTMDEGQTMIPAAPFAFKASHFTRGKDGAPSTVYPPLSADADKGDQDPLVCAPMISFGANDHGGDALDDVATTLRAGGHDKSHANGGMAPAVAFQPRFARNGRGGPQEVAHPLTAEAGRTGKGDSSQAVAFQTGIIDAPATEADTVEALRALRHEIGAQAFSEWGLGVADSLQAQEILRHDVHGGSVRCEADEVGRGLDDGTLSRKENSSSGTVSEMRESGRQRRAPQGRRLSQQRTEQLNSALSQLSHEGTQSTWVVRCLRVAGEGLGVLQQALSSVQGRETEWVVRRLTPIECERLQGAPDNYTNIPWRGRNGAPDGPRYRILGNAMSVNVMRWIGTRIELVDSI